MCLLIAFPSLLSAAQDAIECHTVTNLRAPGYLCTAFVTGVAHGWVCGLLLLRTARPHVLSPETPHHHHLSAGPDLPHIPRRSGRAQSCYPYACRNSEQRRGPCSYRNARCPGCYLEDSLGRPLALHGTFIKIFMLFVVLKTGDYEMQIFSRDRLCPQRGVQGICSLRDLSRGAWP